MGFWSKKPDKQVEQTPYRSALEPYEGDFSLYSSDHWVSMKVWLPEPLDKMLDQLADHFQCSQSELIRQALFVYVYGRYRFEQMRTQRGGLFKTEHLPLFSFADDPSAVQQKKNRTPELGKNSINTRVFLPALLKDLGRRWHPAGPGPKASGTDSMVGRTVGLARLFMIK